MSRPLRFFTAALLVSLCATAVWAAPPAHERDETSANLQLLLDTIRDNRKALVAVNLQLSGDEAAKFWPLYDRYQQEIAATGDRAVTIINDYIANYRTMSNEKALQLIQDYMAAEADRLKIRREYVSQFAAILPGRTVARLYQIENKMDAVIRYDLASTIPVVEEKVAAGAQ